VKKTLLRLGHDELVDLLDIYDVSLRAAGRSQKTRDWYGWALHNFHDWLIERGDMPLSPLLLTREHIELYLASARTRPSERTGRPLSAKSLMGIYNSLHIFFNWLVERDEITVSPMSRMSMPSLQDAPPKVLDEETLTTLLAHLRRGKDFLSRRDYALVLMYLDTGCRRAELVSANMDAINWHDMTVRVMGKGSRERDVSFGDQAALVLRQYIRARAAHMQDHAYPDPPDGPLWVSRTGQRMTGSSVLLMLKRRARECELPERIYTHLFRHTFAHLFLDAGGDLGDLKKLGGWKTDKMVQHYGSSEAARRAQKHHKQFSPANRLLSKPKGKK
jgi:site-specific recombinase XerD